MTGPKQGIGQSPRVTAMCSVRPMLFFRTRGRGRKLRGSFCGSGSLTTPAGGRPRKPGGSFCGSCPWNIGRRKGAEGWRKLRRKQNQGTLCDLLQRRGLPGSRLSQQSRGCAFVGTAGPAGKKVNFSAEGRGRSAEAPRKRDYLFLGHPRQAPRGAGRLGRPVLLRGGCAGRGPLGGLVSFPRLCWAGSLPGSDRDRLRRAG